MSVVDMAKMAGTWLVTILLGLMFLLAGSVKFTSSEMWTGMFTDWGYPAAFSYVIGGVEVIAGLALFVPALAAYAAMVLAVVMVGAATTHLVHDQMFMFDVVVMLLALLIVWLRRPSWLMARSPARPQASEATGD